MNHPTEYGPAADAEAMEAVERHHASMLQRLTALTDAR